MSDFNHSSSVVAGKKHRKISQMLFQRRSSRLSSLSQCSVATISTQSSKHLRTHSRSSQPRQRKYRIPIGDKGTLVLDHTDNSSVFIPSLSPPPPARKSLLSSTAPPASAVALRSFYPPIAASQLSLRRSTLQTNDSTSLGSFSQLKMTRRSSNYLPTAERLTGQRRLRRSFSSNLGLHSRQFLRERGELKEKFRRAARLVRILVTATRGTQTRKRLDFDAKTKQVASDGGTASVRLGFDPSAFKTSSEKRRYIVSDEFRSIMSSPCERRGETKISNVMTILQTLPLFCEYPLEQQKRISRYAQFDELEAGRIIVRQGHRAETFYWILSGIATVTVIESVDGTNTSALKDVLNAGDSINESPVLTGSLRDHTVTCKDTVQILSINRKELVELISDDPSVEAPHIAYCRKLSLFEDFPLSVLYTNADKSAFHFFRRGAVIVKNSKENEWLYVIKSGSCQVLKRLRQVKAKLHQATKTHLLEEESLPDINRSNRLTAQKSKEPKSRKTSTQISCQCCQQSKKSDLPPVFVQLDVLKPRDGFGFAELVFETTPSVSLVSNGAECVMISKKLFLQHMNSLCRQRVLREAKLYPTDATLQKKLQDQANWKEYKRVTLDTALKRVEERDRFVAH